MCARCGDDDNDGDGDYDVDHTVGRLGLVWYISAGWQLVVQTPVTVTGNLKTGDLTAPLRRSGLHRTFL